MKYLYSILLIAFVCWITYSCSNGKNIRKTKQGGKIAEKVAQLKEKGEFKDSMSLETVQVTGAKKFPYDMIDAAGAAESIMEQEPETMTMTLPIDGKTVNLLLYKTESSTVVKTDKGIVPLPQRFKDYHGQVDGDSKSLVALSFSQFGIKGTINTGGKIYTIGSEKGDISGNEIIYQDTTKRPFTCGSDTLGPVPGAKKMAFGQSLDTSSSTTKCVQLYWETDYDLFQMEGSVAAVDAYIHALFNQVKIVYDNDGININLKTLFIWSTVDPYTGPNTGSYLGQFGDRMEALGNYGADLAALLGTQGNGGIAWIGTPCTANRYETSYSAIQSYFNNYPSYSWSVMVLCHEMGHNLGSPHTQSCSWSGGAIDNCYQTEGGCPPGPAPVNGGTIMSYCHLTQYGINLANGFGPLPRAQIINTINASSCLVPCGPPPPPPPNAAPIARAGADQTITATGTALNGNASTDDKAITNWQWNKVQGSGTITNSNAPATTVTGLTQGVSTFQLIVTDAEGLQSTDEVQITVNAAPPPPPPDNCAATARKNYITVRIDTFYNRAKALAGPGTWNFLYAWKVNGVSILPKTQILYKAGNYKKGDSLTVVVRSANKNNAQNCYIPGQKTIYIK